MIYYEIVYVEDHERKNYIVQSSTLKRLFLEILDMFDDESIKVLSIERIYVPNLDKVEYDEDFEKILD